MAQAAAISETIHLTVDTVKDNLVRSLMAIDPDKRVPTLQDWEKPIPWSETGLFSSRKRP